MIFYVEKRKKGNYEYFALCCDLGYRVAVLSIDKTLIAEIVGCCPTELYSLKEGEKRHLRNK